MKNLKEPLILFGIAYIIYGIVMNIRMFTEQMWPTFLFFISIVIGIILLLLNRPTKKLKHYKIWQIVIGLIPVTFFFIYMQIVNANNEFDIKTENSIESKTSYFRQGIWINEKDSLVGIEIKGGNWIMFYKGQEIDPTDIYEFTITNELPKYTNTKLKAGKFLILTNKSDTLNYEILGYNKEFLNLKYFPKGNILTYRKEK
ncbi:hypothetical protein SB49_10915 [Sediminicola sp. YIK13]|uniref:hypothetical protein n=1 Tax=Sediminicola sp. YIK13 TaxID=1453352 RepID=UPI00071FFE31|nr:hypothetical protein [Sediminicola sp. YIK13]ALM08256.1 hypothetical protein SB49_10915 [Sediminicola sp. YIK13]